MGLRWDFFQVPHDINRKWRSLRLDILTKATDGRMLPTVVPEPNADFDFYANGESLFHASVGIAYRATDKWVIRAGGGWFANVQQMNNMTILDLQPPFSGTFGFNQVDQAALTLSHQLWRPDLHATNRRFTPGSQILTLDNPFPGQGTAAAAPTFSRSLPTTKRAASCSGVSIPTRPAGQDSPDSWLRGQQDQSYRQHHLELQFCRTPSTNTDFNGRRPCQAYVSQGEGDRRACWEPSAIWTVSPTPITTRCKCRRRSATATGSRPGWPTPSARRSAKATGVTIRPVTCNLRTRIRINRRQNRGRYGFDVTHNAVINYV